MPLPSIFHTQRGFLVNNLIVFTNTAFISSFETEEHWDLFSTVLEMFVWTSIFSFQFVISSRTILMIRIRQRKVFILWNFWIGLYLNSTAGFPWILLKLLHYVFTATPVESVINLNLFHLRQGIQDWTKWILWKTIFKKLQGIWSA